MGQLIEQGRSTARPTWSDAVVVACGAAFAVTMAMVMDSWPERIGFVAYAAAMAGAAIIDLHTHRVPNRYVVVATAAVTAAFLTAGLTGHGSSLVRAVGGALGLALIFTAIHLAAPQSFGAADAKISFIVGMACSWEGLFGLWWMLFWTWLALAVVGIPTIALRGRAARTRVAFVPFIAFGSFVTILLAAT